MASGLPKWRKLLSGLYKRTDALRANQRAPHGGLQLKRCYEGRRVHGIRPRGAMVSSGEGAGRVRATTGVVGRCRNTGGRIGTGETKRNEGRGTYCYLTTYTGNVYKVQCMRQLRGMYKCGTRLCATAGRLGMVLSATVGHCRNCVTSVGTSARRRCLISTSIPT